jgi:hypothetical protein
MRNPALGGASASLASDNEASKPKTADAQPSQPAWVPELIDLLIDLHRRRASRHAYLGVYAQPRPDGRYPDQAS